MEDDRDMLLPSFQFGMESVNGVLVPLSVFARIAALQPRFN